MEQVIVTVKKEERSICDLEVPAEIPSSELTDLIVEALGWQSNDRHSADNYRLATEPPGRELDAGESLADVGAWDGAYVTLLPPGVKYSSPYKVKNSQPPDPGVQSPGDIPVLGGWESITHEEDS